MAVELDPVQIKAAKELKNGSILAGGVGSGKSRTAIYYWFTKVNGGSVKVNGKGHYREFTKPHDLYIITTPKKRDDLEWFGELAPFGIGSTRETSVGHIQVTVDSWNNIAKYTEVKDGFFIFDEQRLVGSGAWSRSFLAIAKKNCWIVLSATPGDVWLDYTSIFIANGFHKNRTEFTNRHVVYSRFSKYPKVERYVDEGYLLWCRRQLLTHMPVHRHTKRHVQDILVEHSVERMQEVLKKRWHIYEERPIRDVAELFLVMRKLVNTDPSRLEKLKELLAKHPRLIIFYNFNYELDLLRELMTEIQSSDPEFISAEWNGQKHEPVPESDRWAYLVQYTAGAEGWNCITTDAMVFYSQNYSYKVFEQSQGRIDRMNTPYKDLYYYVFRSSAGIDDAIRKALSRKEKFNEKAYSKKMGFEEEMYNAYQEFEQV